MKRIVLLLSKAINVFLATMPLIYYLWYAQDAQFCGLFFFLNKPWCQVSSVCDRQLTWGSQPICYKTTKKLILYNNLLRGLDKINQEIIVSFRWFPNVTLLLPLEAWWFTTYWQMNTDFLCSKMYFRSIHVLYFRIKPP